MEGEDKYVHNFRLFNFLTDMVSISCSLTNIRGFNENKRFPQTILPNLN